MYYQTRCAVSSVCVRVVSASLCVRVCALARTHAHTRKYTHRHNGTGARAHVRQGAHTRTHIHTTDIDT